MTDYLSAEYLKCTEAERDALITVYGRLDRAEKQIAVLFDSEEQARLLTRV